MKKADRERDNSSNYNPAKDSTKPKQMTYVYNEEGKKIGKRDSQGVMHPYKSRGRPPKNLGQKQTGLTEPDSQDETVRRKVGKGERKTDIELEDILQSKTNQADSVSLKTKEHDQYRNAFGKENGASGMR